jgi:hypothetical protein
MPRTANIESTGRSRSLFDSDVPPGAAAALIVVQEALGGNTHIGALSEEGQLRDLNAPVDDLAALGFGQDHVSYGGLR